MYHFLNFIQVGLLQAPSNHEGNRFSSSLPLFLQSVGSFLVKGDSNVLHNFIDEDQDIKRMRYAYNYMRHDTHLSDLTESERKLVKTLISKDEDEENLELTVKEVAEKVDIHQSNVSRGLRRLEDQGVLEHSKIEEDSRKKLYSLSKGFDESIYALRRQEDDLEDIKSYEGVRIQQDYTNMSGRQTGDIEIALYGAEKDLDIKELGIESDIKEVVEALRREHAEDCKSQFKDRLEDLIKDQFKEEEQKKILNILDNLVEAYWHRNELYAEYFQKNREQYGEEEAVRKLMEEPKITLEILSVRDDTIKQVLGSVEHTKEFFRRAYNILEDCMSMKMVIDC